jgi:steroid delta-isomerase-like uncharacterized protein
MPVVRTAPPPDATDLIIEPRRPGENLGEAMNQSEANKALIRAHYDATANAFKPMVIDRQVAPDFIDHGDPAVTGPDGVKAHIKRLRAAFPDLSITIEDMVAEGDLVAVRGTWRGTHQGEFKGVPPIGRRIEFSGMVFWRVSGGQIRERWGLIDTPALMRQLQG